MPTVDAGLVALAAGQVSAAREELRAALAADGTSARGWKGLVQACRKLKDWQGALVALDGVLSTTKGGADAVASLAVKAAILDRHLHQQQQAIKALERVLQLDDTNAHAWLSLAELNLRKGRWQNAVAHADHGLQFGVLDDRQRGFLLLIRALGQHRSSLSVGPVSSFFNALGNTGGQEALEQALEAWPHLARQLPEEPLQQLDETAEVVRAQLPRAAPPSWWGR